MSYLSALNDALSMFAAVVGFNSFASTLGLSAEYTSVQTVPSGGTRSNDLLLWTPRREGAARTVGLTRSTPPIC